MDRHVSARILVLLAVAATLAVGCGSSGATASRSTPSTSSGQPRSAAQFVRAVKAIHARTVAARTRYFRGSDASSAVIAEVRGAQAAYADAARRMAALRPPAAGAAVQRKLTAIYRRAAEDLAHVLSHKPFDRDRANTIMMAAHDSGDAAYGDVFTLPQ